MDDRMPEDIKEKLKDLRIERADDQSEKVKEFFKSLAYDSFDDGFIACYELMSEKMEWHRNRVKDLECFNNENRETIISLQSEKSNLKAIIAKELSENDDFGAEYVIASILKEENAKLREALRFYADHEEMLDFVGDDHKALGCIPSIDDFETIPHEPSRFFGKRARLALKECEDGK